MEDLFEFKNMIHLVLPGNPDTLHKLHKSLLESGLTCEKPGLQALSS